MKADPSLITFANALARIGLGVIYLFSVFRTPFMNKRVWLLAFTISSFVLGLSALFGHLLLTRRSPALIVAFGVLLCGLGLFLASFSNLNLWSLRICYGAVGAAGVGLCDSALTAVFWKWPHTPSVFADSKADTDRHTHRSPKRNLLQADVEFLG